MREQLQMLQVPQRKNLEPESIRREVQWAWLAGIIDGEGNLNVQVREAWNGKPYFRPKIRVANTDVRMIAKIGELYVQENIVFFYNLNTHHQRINPGRGKGQLNIEVASQGSGRKVLEKIIPHLANKKRLAEILLDLICFVQQMPKGGNTKAIEYTKNPDFIRLRGEFDVEAKWYVDPSTTTRRARELLSW